MGASGLLSAGGWDVLPGSGNAEYGSWLCIALAGLCCSQSRHSVLSSPPSLPGDKPELLYPEAAAELAAMGYGSTLEYVAAAAGAVLAQTGLLPHINAGVMGRQELRALRGVSVSQGLMLESTSQALLLPGGAHHDCPDKVKSGVVWCGVVCLSVQSVIGEARPVLVRPALLTFEGCRRILRCGWRHWRA